MSCGYDSSESTPRPTTLPRYGTDEGQYVIQGFGLDVGALAQVGEIPRGEAVIRVPKELMRHLPEVCHHAGNRPETAEPAA